MKAFIIRMLLLIFIVWGSLALLACFKADGMIFYPPAPSYDKNSTGIVTFKTTGVESIAAFYYPAAKGQPTVLYSHGNAEDVGHSMEIYREWIELGWGVLAYDYPGYGQSDGAPTEDSCYRAIDAAWRYLTDTQAVNPEDIVVIGRSIGSGPSVWLAAEQKCKALVLIAPLKSTYAVMPPAQYLLPGNRFNNLKRIKNIKTPTLVIHGANDTVIPASHGRKLMDASGAGVKKYIEIPDVGHNDLYYYAKDQVIKDIQNFTEKL